jgi:hypothetical protein
VVCQIRPKYARRLKRKHRGYGDTFYIDEVFAGVPDHKINGKRRDFWVLMLPFTTCSILDAISFEQSTIEISGKVRSQNGVER